MLLGWSDTKTHVFVITLSKVTTQVTPPQRLSLVVLFRGLTVMKIELE